MLPLAEKRTKHQQLSQNPKSMFTTYLVFCDHQKLNKRMIAKAYERDGYDFDRNKKIKNFVIYEFDFEAFRNWIGELILEFSKKLEPIGEVRNTTLLIDKVKQYAANRISKEIQGKLEILTSSGDVIDYEVPVDYIMDLFQDYFSVSSKVGEKLLFDAFNLYLEKGEWLIGYEYRNRIITNPDQLYKTEYGPVWKKMGRNCYPILYFGIKHEDPMLSNEFLRLSTTSFNRSKETLVDKLDISDVPDVYSDSWIASSFYANCRVGHTGISDQKLELKWPEVSKVEYQLMMQHLRRLLNSCPLVGFGEKNNFYTPEMDDMIRYEISELAVREFEKEFPLRVHDGGNLPREYFFKKSWGHESLDSQFYQYEKGKILFKKFCNI